MVVCVVVCVVVVVVVCVVLCVVTAVFVAELFGASLWFNNERLFNLFISCCMLESKALMWWYSCCRLMASEAFGASSLGGCDVVCGGGFFGRED